MRAIPFDDLNRAARDSMNFVAEAPEKHVQVGEAQAAGFLGVSGQLGGITVPTIEGAKVLAPHGFESVLVDLRDGGQGEVVHHEHVAAAESKDHGVFTRVFGGFVMRNEAVGRIGYRGHAPNLTESRGPDRSFEEEVGDAGAR